MRKKDERDDPNSCWNKATDEEVVFVLLDRDLSFADTVRYWINKRIALGLNQPGDPKLVEAEETAAKVEKEWKELLSKIDRFI